MNRELCIAFCLSLALHAAVVSVWPAPRPTIPGDNGEKQDIVVLGVVELISPTVKEIEHPKPPEFSRNLAAFLTHKKNAPLAQEPEKEQKRDSSKKILESQIGVPTTGQEGSPGKEEPSQGQIHHIRFRYLSKVMQKLEAVKKYPPEAYRRRITGTTEVTFTILANGDATAIETRSSSRYAVLDNASRSIIIRASQFEPLPKELGLNEMQIVVPVAFKIRNR